MSDHEVFGPGSIVISNQLETFMASMSHLFLMAVVPAQEITFFEEGEPMIDGEAGDLKVGLAATEAPAFVHVSGIYIFSNVSRQAPTSVHMNSRAPVSCAGNLALLCMN